MSKVLDLRLRLFWGGSDSLSHLQVEHVGPVLPIPLLHPSPTSRASAVFNLLDDQMTTVRIASRDGAQNPITFARSPTWSVDVPLVSLTPSADGLACQVAPIAGAGTGPFTVTAKAGDGRTIGAVAFTLNPDFATVGLSVDDPVMVPAAVPDPAPTPPPAPVAAT